MLGTWDCKILDLNFVKNILSMCVSKCAYVCTCVCLSVCMCVCVYACVPKRIYVHPLRVGTQKGQKKATDPLEVELWS